jgi:hypothetical protein
MCSSVKPSKAGGSFFERISLCLTCTRAALARPRQYNPVNLKRVRMTEWIEYQVLDVEESQSLAENLSFVIGLNSETLLGI